MSLLLDLTPHPGDQLPWEAMRTRFAWVRALYECPQDSAHHAEGDVGIHTRMVLESLTAP